MTVHRLTVGAIADLVAASGSSRLPALLRELSSDDRAGVQALVARTRARLARERAEDLRVERMFEMERDLHARGIGLVAGVDEVGRGALAGPLTTCAVVLEPDVMIAGLNDSKRLSPAARETVALRVREVAIAWSVASVTSQEIDRLGIAPATRLAWSRAVAGLGVAVDHVLVDGNDARVGVPATAVVGGDRIVACIAAASVVAKVARDRHMEILALTLPGYGLEVNRGYGTAGHLAAIASRGPSAEHRRSFAPCADQTRLL